MKRFVQFDTDSYLARAAKFSAGAVLTAALMTAAGCTSETRIVPTEPGVSDGTKFRSKRVGLFDELIERQKTQPDRSVRSAETGESEISSRAKPLADHERAKADLSLDEVLATISKPAIEAPAVGPQMVSESDRKDAIAKYLSGRQKLADGKFTDALDDLFASAKLDPLAAEPHRALAEANMGLGRTTAALKAFHDAAARGSNEPKIFWLLGRDALKSGNAAEAAALLNVARKTLSESPGTDKALFELVQCDLGDAIGAMGHLRAMVGLRQNVLSRFRDTIPSQALRSEFGELYRREGELHLSNGDALWRLGDFDAASREYSLAEETGLVDPGLTMSRWFETLLKQGRTAEIADRLLTEAAEHPERLDATRLALLKSLAQSEAGSGLRSGFAQLHGESKTPSLSLILARASAATAENSSAAREILAAELGRSDAEPEALAAYLATWPVNAASERAIGTIALVTKQPHEAARYAQALAAEGHDPAVVEAAVNDDTSIAARLLKAELLAAWGRYSDATTSLEGLQVPADANLKFGCLTITGELAAQSGNWPLAESSIESLNALGTAQGKLAAAGIQRVMQRYSSARANLETVAGSKPSNATEDVSKMDALLRGAELAARVGEGERAVELLSRAVAADPHDERSYSGLIAIASAAKPVDQQRIGAIVREMRQNCPTSRGARSLRFQQLLGSVNTQDGAATVLGVVKTSPQDVGILEQLCGFAERNSTTNPTLASGAESSLSLILAERPGSVGVRRGLARVLAARGKHEQAIEVLDRMPAQIADVQTLRLKEKILKENLKKDAESLAVETQRMTLVQPGIDSAIETGDWLWRANKFDAAVSTITAAIAPGAELDIEQQAKLLFMASRAMATLSRLPEEPRQGNSDEGRRALALFDAVALHEGKLLPQHHQARLILLGVNAPTDFARLLAAANVAGEQHPSLKSASLRLVADAAGTEVPRRGGEFLHYVAANTKDVPAPIVTLIIRRAIAFGTLEDVTKAMDLAEDPARVGAVLADFDASLEPSATTIQQQAELAYIVASGLTVQGDEAGAEVMYRRALARDPKHGLANNDLGYALLEKGELEKAGPLIEAAAAALADRSHVVDSLGWLRYKQGKMRDTAATASGPASEGAITILRRALQIDNGNEAAMLDHLGDALWADGQRTQAVNAWQQAVTSADLMLREIRSISASRESMVKELKEISASATKKLTAHRNRVEPAIAMFPGRKEPGTPIAAQEEK